MLSGMSTRAQRFSELSWKQMKDRLHYLIDTKWHGIPQTRGTEFPNVLTTFVDVSLKACEATGRAAYCVMIFLNGDPIYWRCKLLPGKPSASALEAQYSALDFATNATMHYRQYMYELGFPQKSPTIIYSDNAASYQQFTKILCHDCV